jgi:predicted phosphoribosyltransferase
MYSIWKKGITARVENKIISNTITIVLVDDGAASGATVIAAARSVRKVFNPNKLVSSKRNC